MEFINTKKEFEDMAEVFGTDLLINRKCRYKRGMPWLNLYLNNGLFAFQQLTVEEPMNLPDHMVDDFFKKKGFSERIPIAIHKYGHLSDDLIKDIDEFFEYLKEEKIFNNTIGVHPLTEQDYRNCFIGREIVETSYIPSINFVTKKIDSNRKNETFTKVFPTVFVI